MHLVCNLHKVIKFRGNFLTDGGMPTTQLQPVLHQRTGGETAFDFLAWCLCNRLVTVDAVAQTYSVLREPSKARQLIYGISCLNIHIRCAGAFIGSRSGAVIWGRRPFG